MFSGISYKIASRSIKSSAGFNMLVGGQLYQPIWITSLSTRLNSDGNPDSTFSVGSGFSLNHIVNSVSVQSDNKIICGGTFVTYNGTSRNRILRLNSDGSLDSTFSVGSGFNNTVNCTAIQSDGKILCGGTFTSYNGTTRNRIIRLNSDGTLDSTFSVGSGFNTATVSSISIQSDGKILCGGQFSAYNGTTRNRIIRLNSDGTLDSTFSIGSGFNNSVNFTAIQSDGKIICGGSFTIYNGTTRTRIIRLNSDGTLDSTFSVGSGFNGTVSSISIQSDNKIICGGSFTGYNGTPRNRIIRLNSDGTLDSTFSIGSGFNNSVNFTAIQSDGKILCGGAFTSYNGTTRARIARLNSDGSIDSSFNSVGVGFNNTVFSVAIQSDDKIICGGSFSYLFLNEISNIFSLKSNGIPNSSFATGVGFGFDGYVNSLVRQTDGKLICGGAFTNAIARLNSDGSLDSTFNIGTGFSLTHEVKSIAIQSDGKIICCGNFTSYDGITKNLIVRINFDGTLDSTFDCSLFQPFDHIINTIAVQSDGKIIVGGYFFLYDEANDFISSRAIVRLNSDGTLDSSFSVGSGFISIAGNPYSIRSIAIQSDGKIICVGQFNSYNGTTTNCIARLNSDGSIDSSFSVGSGFNDTVETITIQSDGKIICGGAFTSYNGVARSCIVRLNSDGSLDSSFSVDSGFNNTVTTITIQSDNKIICGGYFSSYNGTARYAIARLNSDGTLDSNFAISTGLGVDNVNSIILI